MKILSVSLALFALTSMAQERLPLPSRGVPELPQLLPSVVTAEGNRLLLAEAPGVVVRWDGSRLVANRPGWWLVNFPFDRIATDDGKPFPVEKVFGAEKVRNWYLRTAGTPVAEPAAPTGPAAVVPSGMPTRVVQPGESIQAAVDAARPGDVLVLKPGVYRETVMFDRQKDVRGTADNPLEIVGERDAAGRMPVFDGNDPFPSNAWKAVASYRYPNGDRLWRAPLFTGIEGALARDGAALRERTQVGELGANECCLNRGALELAGIEAVRLPTEDDLRGAGWETVTADAEGFLDLDPQAEGRVVQLVTHVRIDEQDAPRGVVWDPRFPQPVGGEVTVKGPFRAGRMNGSPLKDQVNPYRLWLNGELLPAIVWTTRARREDLKPHPSLNYGYEDQWSNFSLRPGWNTLVFLIDTSYRMGGEKPRLRFACPVGVRRWRVNAEAARDEDAIAADCLAIARLRVVRRKPEADKAVYLRLPAEEDPNALDLSLGARGTLMTIDTDFTHVRGIAFRNGSQFQQRGQLEVTGEGNLVEGCLFTDSMVKGIGIHLNGDQRSAVTVLRNNWIVRPGNVGIAGGSDSARGALSPENIDTTAPGRSRALIEDNVIIDANLHGFPVCWESGGIKLFNLTGCTIRNNRIVRGVGPAIWLDWQHYGNRIEGNVSEDGLAFGVGIEASPGPNLVANNVCINLQAYDVWFRYGLLAWSTDRYWAVHNTVDGKWNTLPPDWNGCVGSGGYWLNEGQDDRGTIFAPLTNRVQVVAANAIDGCRVHGVDRPANVRLDDPGARHPVLDLVTHDANGLLRFRDEVQPPGAYRSDGDFRSDRLEVEYESGRLARILPAMKE